MSYGVANKDYKDGIVLPEFDIRKNLILRIVSKAVSLTFIILAAVITAAVIILFSVNMDVSISSDGLLVPGEIINMHSPESGIVKSIFVNSGDTVIAGNKIAELDSSELVASLFETESQLALKENDYKRQKENIKFETREDQIALEQAKHGLLKSKAEFRDKLLDFFPNLDADSIFANYVPGSHINLDYAMADVYASQSEIKSCELQLETESLSKYDLKELEIEISQLAQSRQRTLEKLDRLVLRSPVDGVVLTEGLERKKGSYLSEGELFIQISNSSQWKVILFVGESDIHKIEIGDSVKVEISAFQSTEKFEMLKASVISIAAEQITSQDDVYSEYAGLYRVTAKLDKLPTDYLMSQQFKYGYTVKGNIITDSGKLIELLIQYLHENT